jgi:hypothetical protein
MQQTQHFKIKLGSVFLSHAPLHAMVAFSCHPVLPMLTSNYKDAAVLNRLGMTVQQVHNQRLKNSELSM